MNTINETVSIATKGVIATLSVNNPPVNALGYSVRDGLVKGVQQALADPNVQVIVIICQGKTFFAGADIREFGKPVQQPLLGEVINTIEASSKPVIAAMHGTVLGGGLETALACHFRIASPNTQFGLPEVKLGLIPGAGGTQRLPRLIGVERSLEMITGGDPINATQALAWGLIDAMAEGDLAVATFEFAVKIIREGKPVRRVGALTDKIAGDHSRLFERFKQTLAKKFRGFQAPAFCIRAVEATVNLPLAEGLANEHRLFVELLQGIQSAAQRHYFFAERQVSKVPDIPADTPQIAIKSSAVIGAGTMGGGIAMNLVNAGIPVVLVETKQDYLDRGLSVIRKNYQASAAKGKMTDPDVEKRLSLITGTLSIEEVATADLVIEAVYENMNLKKEVFRKLDRICKPGAILASNTSYLNIDEIAAVTGRPEAVIGLHFFSPANVMRLLEIVRGAQTSKTVLATSIALGKAMKKIAVMVGVCYGFAANRMYMQRCRQDGKLILEGASLTQVDKVIYDFGFPLGPFALYDLIGMNVGWDKEHTSSATIKEILCEKGRFGQKSGLGYYKYEAGGRVPIPDPEVEQIILDFSKKQGIQRRQISDEEVLQRCLYAIINEGAKIIEEKIAVRPSDLDVIWVNGYGWPRYLGGPMFYADSIGLDLILDTIKTFQHKFGDDWKPAPLLEKLVAEGKKFGDLN